MPIGARWRRARLADLATLIEYLAEIDGLERIRYTTSHPKEMTQALIDVYRHVPKLVSHLHLPVQSGSDRILAAMKRGYTALEYKSIVRRLRDARPQLSLTSDFIVGFPGETEADFEQTMKLIDDVGFDGSFSFVYSARPGTPAAQFADQVERPVAQARLERLQAVVESQYRARSEAMVGTIERVLVTGRAARNAGDLAAPHRKQSRSELSRCRWSDRAALRRADHGRAGALAARRTGGRFLVMCLRPRRNTLRRKP